MVTSVPVVTDAPLELSRKNGREAMRFSGTTDRLRRISPLRLEGRSLPLFAFPNSDGVDFTKTLAAFGSKVYKPGSLCHFSENLTKWNKSLLRLRRTYE
jgi:hypothetical protein